MENQLDNKKEKENCILRCVMLVLAIPIMILIFCQYVKYIDNLTFDEATLNRYARKYEHSNPKYFFQCGDVFE